MFSVSYIALAMNSLYEKKGNAGTDGPKHKRLTPCATRTIIFRRENSNYSIVSFTQRTLFSSTRFFSIANMIDR